MIVMMQQGSSILTYFLEEDLPSHLAKMAGFVLVLLYLIMQINSLQDIINQL